LSHGLFDVESRQILKIILWYKHIPEQISYHLGALAAVCTTDAGAASVYDDDDDDECAE